jgi:alkylation response protein AidB-like acyl-CoA dehydrogenase
MREWTDEQRALREHYAGIVAAWGEDHIRRDQDGEFPQDIWKLVAESGLLGLPFDPEWGGRGQDLLTVMHVLEELGLSCRDSGLNFSIATHLVSTGIPLQRFGSSQLKARYLTRICDGSAIGAHAITEPRGGSDVAGMVTTARPDGDAFVLSGQKSFVSCGPVADLFVVYARTQQGAGPFGITAFLVERATPGLTVGPSADKMGLRTSPFGELLLDGCVVPRQNVLGQVGNGFFVLDYVMKWEILCSFVITLGAMRNRLARCVEYARTRTQFGRKIGGYQLVADMIVDMKIGVETSSRWLYDTAERFLAGASVMQEIAITKLLVSEANLRSATNAVRIFGGRGYLTEYGVEKELRDAVGGTIYSGTSEIQRDKIARMLGVA